MVRATGEGHLTAGVILDTSSPVPVSDTEHSQAQDNENDNQHDQEELINPPANPPIARVIDGHTECPFCYCAPCITSPMFAQSWWPSRNADPSRLNRTVRNSIYRRFWSAMYNREVWCDHRYKAK